MRLEVVNPLHDDSWNDLVLTHGEATVFHSREWAEILWDSYGFPAHYGIVRDGGRLTALLAVMQVSSRLTGCRGVSLPFSDECAPLLSGSVTVEDLLGPVVGLGRSLGWQYLEIRSATPRSGGSSVSSSFISHEVEMGAGEDGLYRALKPGHRRNIAGAKLRGVSVQVLDTWAAVEGYYLLHCQTRRRHGLPPQPVGFFRALHRRAIGPGRGVVVLATSGGRCVSGAVFLRFGATAVYKFGASDPACRDLRPGYLVMWEALRHLRSTGVRKVSLGRTDPDQAGLLRFKRGWGAHEANLSYSRINLTGTRRLIAAKGRGLRLLAPVFRRLPIQILQRIGAAVYPHIA
ncbi:MAG: GNAT family N-acetyltransferase [Bryobacterales bacterium]|nr:GNAT family N-acetyltransferase [Bryobacterales bacterium]